MKKTLNKILIALLVALSFLPFSVLFGISDFIYFLLFHVTGYRKKVVYSNLRNAFPEKSEKEIDDIARKFYRHLSDLGVEAIKLQSISEKELDKRITVSGIEKTEEYFRQQKSIILLGMHFNNWEWSASLQRLSKHQLIMVYNPVRNNKEMERYILNMRERFGAISVPVHKSARTAMQFDQTERPGCIWLGADQTPAPTTKFWTQFLNQETPFFSGPEKIASKTNQPVFLHYVRKLSRGKYEVNFIELFPEPAKEKPDDILLTYIDRMEEIIQETPEFWLWSHRRWKHKRPEGIEMIKRLPNN
ncbi:lysophospholipid acyltransferase family protein [Sunxiuqinia sp. sy24]|uniref:lysophospholipid acyltransferase family protein n=1 Tax=Sunxiuqinia sp. sy24 TaxID=3461495 RepID=UPI0040460F64